jgi:hypothetical protein
VQERSLLLGGDLGGGSLCLGGGLGWGFLDGDGLDWGSFLNFNWFGLGGLGSFLGFVLLNVLSLSLLDVFGEDLFVLDFVFL